MLSLIVKTMQIYRLDLAFTQSNIVQKELYIGKAGNIRSRFAGGHKAISWAYVERIAPDDIRICAVVLSNEWRRSRLELETLMIQTLKPRYNIRIRAEE